MTWAETLGRQAQPDGRQVFRSPIATLIWWIWVLFAVGNLIDLAVQGRDHLSVIAACTLLVITGIVYATAQRPRIIADDDGLTIVNPVRVHQVGWPAVVGFDPTELLRVRCLWTRKDGTQSEMRAFYAWAAHSSRRRKLAEEMRAQRRARGGGARGVRFGGFGAPPVDDAPPPAPLGLDVDIVVATLTERAEQVRSDAVDVRAQPPVSSWYWPAVAAIVAPALALLIAILV
jgi:PH (Pleckstrin Homology) domain-containing protein